MVVTTGLFTEKGIIENGYVGIASEISSQKEKLSKFERRVDKKIRSLETRNWRRNIYKRRKK